ncbi:MAG: AAA family ATPase [Deltaproteobacteria bacterium]|nr:AAA family ATPase [Deltaproteobacteria bacterium]
MPRITQLRLRGVRVFDRVDLELDAGLTVLVGTNGSGKSTILECLEILRKAAHPGFLPQFYGVHRGLPALLRKGENKLVIGTRIATDDDWLLDYDLEIEQGGGGNARIRETLRNVEDGFAILIEGPAGTRVWSKQEPVRSEGSGDTAIGSELAAKEDERIRSVAKALRGIEVHLGFDTRASWAARTYRRPETIRGAATLYPADRLDLLGVNLANAWNELLTRPAAQRDEALGMVRLGLGEAFSDVVVRPDPGGGTIHLAVRLRDHPEHPIFASDLSDGQLTWLAFVAIVLLAQQRTIVAIDEPELHLHPSLLGRVMAALGSPSMKTQTLVATHSDRALELIDEPAKALRVCESNRSRATIRRLDEAAWPRWREAFGDLGQVRASGYLERALQVSEDAP